MIEMIAVLAVIMVLTMVGIAGYSKAMMQYKTNKLKDQLTQIQYNTVEGFNLLGDYRQLGTVKEDATELAKEVGIFPENMVMDDGSIRHAFGGNVYIRAVEYADREGLAFTVELEDLPKEVAVKLSTDPANEGNTQLMYIDLEGASE